MKKEALNRDRLQWKGLTIVVFGLFMASCVPQQETSIIYIENQAELHKKYHLISTPKVSRFNVVSKEYEDGSLGLNETSSSEEKVGASKVEARMLLDNPKDPKEIQLIVSQEQPGGLKTKIILEGNFNEKKQAYLTEKRDESQAFSRMNARAFCVKPDSCRKIFVQIDYLYDKKYWSVEFILNRGKLNEGEVQGELKTEITERKDDDVTNSAREKQGGNDHTSKEHEDINIGEQTSFSGLSISEKPEHLLLSEWGMKIFDSAQEIQSGNIKLSQSQLRDPSFQELFQRLVSEKQKSLLSPENKSAVVELVNGKLRVVEEEVKQSADEEVKKSADEEAKKSVDDEAKKSADEEVKESADEEVKESADEEVKESADDEANQPVDEEANQPVDEEVKESVDEEAKQSADEEVKESVDNDKNSQDVITYNNGTKTFNFGNRQGYPHGGAGGYDPITLEPNGVLAKGSKLKLENKCLNFSEGRDGHYSSGILASTLEEISKGYCEKYGHDIFVNDSSLEGGGFFWKQGEQPNCEEAKEKQLFKKNCLAHKSHQNGMDVDISYIDRGAQRDVVERINKKLKIKPNFNAKANFEFIKLMVTAKYRSKKTKKKSVILGIFVSEVIKKSLCEYIKAQENITPDDITTLHHIIPYRGHKSHMHIRFACPPSSDGNNYGSCAVTKLTNLPLNQSGCESFHIKGLDLKNVQ